nr:osmc family protein [uncultured bacterium]
MAHIDITYEGDLSTRCVHSENHAEILTDAPKDHHGLGRVFSPTDLFAASLGSCMLTLIGLHAKRLQINIQGMRAKVTKEMAPQPPRRISSLRVEFDCPVRPSEEEIAKLTQAAESCPVHKSLHPDIVVECTYRWGS